MKILDLVKDCVSCPRRVYYSGGVYNCAESDTRLPERKTLEQIGFPAWCPLREYGTSDRSSRIAALEAERDRLQAELAEAKRERDEYHKTPVFDRVQTLASDILVQNYAPDLSKRAMDDLTEKLIDFACREARPYLDQWNEARRLLEEQRVRTQGDCDEAIELLERIAYSIFPEYARDAAQQFLNLRAARALATELEVGK